MNWGLVMIDDITDELMNLICEKFGYPGDMYHVCQQKIKTELARYAIAALADSKIALEAEQFLAKGDIV